MLRVFLYLFFNFLVRHNFEMSEVFFTICKLPFLFFLQVCHLCPQTLVKYFQIFLSSLQVFLISVSCSRQNILM